MSWLALPAAQAELACAYCGRRDRFALALGFAHLGHVHRLWRCPGCASLAYHPMVGRLAIPRDASPAYRRNTAVGAKYFLEAGCNDSFVAQCVMSALAAVPPAELPRHLFVDIGAGFGMSSLLAQRMFGVEVVAVEPSYSGELGRALLGVPIHSAFVEDLPAPVRAAMRARPCLLHLNSVIEHLDDPHAAVAAMMREARVAALAAIVPDAAAIDGTAPFGTMVQSLAPGDHLHLPTAEGMRRLYARLGFAHAEVRESAGLLLAVGAGRPFALPDDAAIRAVAGAFQQRLMQAPDPAVAGGAAARLLPHAVLSADAAALARLRAHFAARLDPAALRAALARPDAWDEVPFHLPTTAFWLGVDAFQRAAPAEGFAWWDLVELSADRLLADHPIYALQAADHRWESRLLRAHHLARLGDPAAARAWLATVVASAADRINGARAGQIARAQAQLDGPGPA